MNEQQRTLLLFIDERIRTTGVSPTLQEMAAAIGNKHRSGAHRYLAMLEAEGWIRRMPRRKQSLEVVRTPGCAALTDLASEDVISRLAAELTRRNVAGRHAQRTMTVSAAWILETIEAAGFRLIDAAARPGSV